jgi:hypothetical protein
MNGLHQITKSAVPFVLALALGYEGSAVLARRFGAEPGARPARIEAAHANELELVLASEGPIDLRRGDAALRFRLESRLPGAAVARYAVELVDDLGRELERPAESELVRVPRGGSASFAVELPSRLGEGYALCRVTVAGRAGSADADHLLEVGLFVANGVAHVLTSEEWLRRSLANQGV